jgi:hypothetical protein
MRNDPLWLIEYLHVTRVATSSSYAGVCFSPQSLELLRAQQQEAIYLALKRPALPTDDPIQVLTTPVTNLCPQVRGTTLFSGAVV